MKSSNNRLFLAKKIKNNEFFTRNVDIQKEIKYYQKNFENKVVLCNCNDGLNSEFWKYFYNNFNKLKLKKLIAISYGDNATVFEYDGNDIIMTKLNNNGSFKSFESIQYLRQSDIVVTNPPFSKFREFINLLIDFNKKFLIIGHLTAIVHNNTFNYFKENKIWLGYNIDMHFRKNNILKSSVPCLWYTNLNHNYTPPPLLLTKKYSPKKYPKYDNYNAINVNKTKDIPKDYYDDMGVPISFIYKWNPDQFKLVDTLIPKNYKGNKSFWRLIIKRKTNASKH